MKREDESLSVAAIWTRDLTKLDEDEEAKMKSCFTQEGSAQSESPTPSQFECLSSHLHNLGYSWIRTLMATYPRPTLLRV